MPMSKWIDSIRTRRFAALPRSQGYAHVTDGLSRRETMSQPSRFFREQFSAMDTALLLQRHRSGGMVHDAEVALLSVLEARGYTRETLAQETLMHASTITAPLLPDKPAKMPLIPLSHPSLRRLTIALRCLIIPVVVVFALLAIPLVGNFVVLEGASLLGCSVGEDKVHPCLFLGQDIGDFVYGYVVDIFLLGGFNPFFSAIAFANFIRSAIGIVWLLLVVGMYGARVIKRRQLTMKKNGTAG
jgi:hypothetical protein